MVTEDGYISEMYRLPGKLTELGHAVEKPAVLMMHGLMCDMKFWVANDADLAPPFTLVDAGYDVWLGNNRGNRYAQSHTTLDKSEKEFWDFNFVDMGAKDTPAYIDFVLDKTGQDKLTYIGHSQGTAQVFAGASLYPELYEDKLNLFVALAPVANTYTIDVPSLQHVARMWRLLQIGAIELGVYNMFGLNWWLSEADLVLCSLFDGFCEKLIEELADSDPTVDNMSRKEVFMADFPSGSSY